MNALRFLLFDVVVAGATATAAIVAWVFCGGVFALAVAGAGMLLLLLVNSYRILFRLMPVEEATRYTAESISELQTPKKKIK